MQTNSDVSSPAEFVQMVATATGESRKLIHQRGFQPCADLTDEDDTLGLTCPGCGHEVWFSADPQNPLPEWAECAGCDLAYPWSPDELLLRAET